MSWSLICVFIAFIIYLVYNGIAIKLFGIPESLSDTYYLYKDKKDWMRIFFPTYDVFYGRITNACLA